MSCGSNYSLDCLSGTVSSNCVTWQGDNIPLLGIETGMAMTDFEAKIAVEVQNLLSDVDISSVELCGETIALMANKDKTIANLLQTLYTYNCTLRTLISDLQTKINSLSNDDGSVTFDIKCLTYLNTQQDPCNPKVITPNDVIQALITEVCYLWDAINNLNNSGIEEKTKVVVSEQIKNLFVSTHPNRILHNGLSGNSARVTFRGFVPHFTAMLYFGDLANFDNTGKGVGIMEGFYICNGNYGTPDMRGRVGVGSTHGVGGGPLHPEVDPNNYGGQGEYHHWYTGGRVLVKLENSHIPRHKHNVRDNGHTHPYDFLVTGKHPGGQSQNERRIDASLTTGTGYANLSEDYVGGDQPHENRMPYRAGAWIMMID